MVKMVIFDFDLTLFDSSSIKQFMNNRQWKKVYENIPNCKFYPKALEVINYLIRKNIKVTIVSNSPRNYLTKALSFYDVTVDYIVCYHDVYKHKPFPEGVFRVLSYFSIKNHEAIYIGDNDIDFNTSNNANVEFYGVLWGNFSQKVNYISFSDFTKILREDS